MSFRRRLLFLLPVALVCLMLAEVGSRLALASRPRLENHRRRLAGESVASFQNCVGQPYLLYAPLPGYAPAGQPEHNAMGFRGEAVAMRKPEGVVRVLCLGGSTTYGWSVGQASEAWPARLAEELEKRKPAGVGRIEVLNGGLPFGTSAELLTHYLFKWHYFQPDLVVMNESGNDAFALDREWYQPDYAHWRQQPCLVRPLPGATRWLMGSRLLALVLLAATLGSDSEDGASIIQLRDRPPTALWYPEAGPTPPGQREVPDRELAFEHNVRALSTAVASDGARLLYVPFRPAPGNRYGATVRRWMAHNEQRLHAIAAERGVPLAPFPAEVITPGHWTDDCHLDAAGEREKAAHVAPWAARALGWEP